MVALSLAVGVSLGARTASAAPLFDAQTFRPSSTSNGYLNVDSPFVAGHLGGYAGLFLTYARDPLVLRDANGNVAPNGRVIGDQIGLTLVGALSLFRRAEIGVTLPVIVYQSTDATYAPGPIAATAVGDITLDFKVLAWRRAWTKKRQLGFGILGGVAFPSGKSDAFAGHGGFGAHVRALLGYSAPRGSISFSFGGNLRESRQFYDLNITHQITLALAGHVNVVKGLDFLAEAVTAIGVGLPKGSSLQSSEAPVEILGGIRYRTALGLAPMIAGGGGIGQGYGTPVGRVIFGVTYTNRGKNIQLVDLRVSNERTPPKPKPVEPEPQKPIEPQKPQVTDTDGDGIVDSMDACPTTKGALENRGCPDVDADGDGIVDRKDKCPFDPENYNGVDDDDGCDDGGGALVRIEGDAVELKEPINFESGTLFEPKSFRVLDALGNLLRNHPELGKVRIEGHTDNRGGVVENLDLSRDRASTVRRFLIENHRVDAARLVAQGFGADKPIADNKTPQGRAKNRRIDVVILERTAP